MQLVSWNAIILVLVAACAAHDPAPATPMNTAHGDAIDDLVHQLEGEPMWTNGMFPKLELAETTPLDQIVARAFDRVSFDHGPAKRHVIVKLRTVRIAPEQRDYGAAIVDTDVGTKVVLVQWQGPAVGWWSRIFDAP